MTSDLGDTPNDPHYDDWDENEPEPGLGPGPEPGDGEFNGLHGPFSFDLSPEQEEQIRRQKIDRMEKQGFTIPEPNHIKPPPLIPLHLFECGCVGFNRGSWSDVLIVRACSFHGGVLSSFTTINMEGAARRPLTDKESREMIHLLKKNFRIAKSTAVTYLHLKNLKKILESE